MKDQEFSIENINKFLEKNPFKIKNLHLHFYTNVKVKLTGFEIYFLGGEPTKQVEFTLYILKSNKDSDQYYSLLQNIYGNEIDISTWSDAFLRERFKVQDLLSDLLKHFNIEERPICTRVVIEDDSIDLTEGKLLNEDRMDGVVRAVVRDIISIYKNNKEGEFEIPEDLDPERLVYEFPRVSEEFSVFLDFRLDDSIQDFDIDGEYLEEDNTIFITILTNPTKKNEILQEVIGELNEVIRHELEHLKQTERGYEFPDEEPKDPFNYYLQKHETEAQRKGFKRRSRKEKKHFETIVRNWFRKYHYKHKLTPDQIEIIVNRIVSEV